MQLLHLFKRFILRALLKEKIRSIVAVTGIALGVAVMLAIRLANTSVTDTFRAAVDSVSGQASLRIRGSAGRFDELLIAELDWIRRYGDLSPVVECYAMVADVSPDLRSDLTVPRGELLHVLGVDVLLDFPLRDYHVLKTGTTEEQSARQVLALLDDPNSVILTEKFMRRRGLRVGDSIPLAFGSQQQSFKIQGVLLNQGPARTLDGNFALMDIAAAQLAAQRIGLLDYVDVLLDENQSVDEMLNEIRQRLPAGLTVEYPDAASSRADTMVSAFQFNLTALSAVAFIVGLFLIYNTIAISVAARREEIGNLRAVGANRRTVLLLFLGEALLLAGAGLVIGLPLGRFLAGYAVKGTAQTVETFYIAGVAESSASALSLGVTDIVAAIVTAIPLALLAAFLPAWDAATVQPVEAARGHSGNGTRFRLRNFSAAALVCLIIGWAMTLGEPINGQPVLGFLAELMFMLGGAFLTPLILWGICRSARTSVSHLLPWGRVELQLASANLLGSLPRVSVSVAALAVSLSMMIAIAVMVGSFRETVVYWLNSAVSSDLAVKPVMQTSSVSEARLAGAAVDVIRNDPDVDDTVWYSSRQVPFRDKTIRLAVTEMTKAFDRGRFLFKVSPKHQSNDWQDKILVSESFSLRFDVKPGDRVELPTATGSATVPVAGIYYDYASNQGTVMMDVATYQKHYSKSDPRLAPQHLSIYLAADADPKTVRSRLLANVGTKQQIYCVTNSEVRSEAMRIF